MKDLFVAHLGVVVLLVALYLDARRQARRGHTNHDGDSFLVWALRVYCFSVLALPFYFWRTRGRARFALVGVFWAVVWGLLLSLLSVTLGCSSASSEAGRGSESVPQRSVGGREERGAATSRESPLEPLAPLLRRLESDDFREVWAAHQALLDRGDAEVVEALLSRLGETREVPLRNATDVVYPGAARIVGTGPIISYDIDRIGARAGWVLEALTYRRFGFRRTPYPLAETPTEDSAAPERARAWWRAQGGLFSRLGRLTQVLAGEPETLNEAVLSDFARVPLPAWLASSLRPTVVPALRNGLASSEGAHRRLLCNVARIVYFRWLSRDASERDPIFSRPLEGSTTMLAALASTAEPELRIQSDVPGASEVIAPMGAMRLRDALVEFVDRIEYSRGPVSVVVGEDAIEITSRDDAREAAAWQRVLPRD